MTKPYFLIQLVCALMFTIALPATAELIVWLTFDDAKVRNSSVTGGLSFPAEKEHVFSSEVPPGFGGKSLGELNVNGVSSQGTKLFVLELSGGSDFTLSYWIRPTGGGPEIRQLVAEIRIVPFAVGLNQPELGATEMEFSYSYLDGNWIDTGQTIPIDEWTHVTWRVGEKIELFLDGASVLSHQRKVPGSEQTIGFLTIGKVSPLQEETGFRGFIDEVRLHDEQLDEKSIGELFRQVSPIALTHVHTKNLLTVVTLGFEENSEVTIVEKSVQLLFDGKDVTPVLSRDGNLLTLEYAPPEGLEFPLNYDFAVSFRDSTGAEFTRKGRIFVPAPALPLNGVPGAPRSENAWTIRYMSTADVDQNQSLVSALKKAFEPDFGNMIEFESPAINITDPDFPDTISGLFPESRVKLQRLAEADEDPIATHPFVVIGHTTVRHDGGPLTLSVQSSAGHTGFGLRMTVSGTDLPVAFSRVSGDADPITGQPSIVLLSEIPHIIYNGNLAVLHGRPGISIYSGLAEMDDLAPGVYDLEFVGFHGWPSESIPTSEFLPFFELSAASGVHDSLESTDEWFLVGDPAVPLSFTQQVQRFPLQILSVLPDFLLQKTTITWSSKPGAEYTVDRSENLVLFEELSDGTDRRILLLTPPYFIVRCPTQTLAGT